MSAHRKPTKPTTAAGVEIPPDPIVRPEDAAPKKGLLAQFLADVTSGAARKFVVGVAGLAASLLAAGLIPSPYNHYVEAALAFLTAAGIYAAKNAPSTADPEAGHSSVGVMLFAVILIAALLLGGFGSSWFFLLIIVALLALFL